MATCQSAEPKVTATEIAARAHRPDPWGLTRRAGDARKRLPARKLL